MTASRRNTPDFFAETSIDPVESATGRQKPSAQPTDAGSAFRAGPGETLNPLSKKKAGFYLSVDILQRFNLKFHELKLAGVAIDNKSTLLELALSYALDDLDKGRKSRVLEKIGD